MWPQLLVLCFCFSFFSCKNSKEEHVAIEIKCYSYEELEYPIEEVQIPDNYEMEYRTNFFVPWNESSEELLNSLDTFPGKELSYLDDTQVRSMNLVQIGKIDKIKVILE